ncbi:hypothetical protein Slin15195_G019940 [Septoria linicola]|uniref:Uncharacterized protein n=1 Tax=Septoria linicola TaxID=215465 RepID=A0A9Q9EF81_9PEZI|nr:hypothetical protein Slin15195_G019940 [Septoria linicola]
MSTAGSKSAQKIVVADDHKRTTSSTPLLATLTEVVKLLLRATQNREFTTDSHFALDALKQAVKITRPYILHLQQELESHNMVLTTSGDNHVKKQFDAATLLTGLVKLTRELARTRDNRPNGSVRLTLLGEVYRLLFVEMKGARKEVKRLEHLLEGKHTRKRHREHRDKEAGEGEEGSEVKPAEEASEHRSASSLAVGSGEAAPIPAGSSSGQAMSPLPEEVIRVYPDAIKVHSHGSQKSHETRASGPGHMLHLGVERSGSHNSSVRIQSPAAADYLHPATEPSPRIESEGSVRTGNHASSRRSQSTEAPTVCIKSDVGNSNSPTHSRNASKPQHEDQRKSSFVTSQAKGLHDLSQLATPTSKHSSIETTSRTSIHKSATERPTDASVAASQSSGKNTSRSGSAVAILGTGDKQDGGDIASESKSVQSASAIATLGTGSKTKEAKPEDRSQDPEAGLAATREDVMTSKQTVPADHVSFEDRLDGGWSFDALKSGSRASLGQRSDESKAKSQESKTK